MLLEHLTGCLKEKSGYQEVKWEENADRILELNNNNENEWKKIDPKSWASVSIFSHQCF